MENPEYQELIDQATKGEKQSLKDLFSLGEKLIADGNFEEAATVFRESAISYRISAFRSSATNEDAEYRVSQLEFIIEQYQLWVEKHKSVFPSLPQVVDGMTYEFIRTTIQRGIDEDSQMGRIIQFVGISLSHHGMEWFSPGGSVQRRITDQLAFYFGLRKDYDNYLQYTDVRIGINLLADEVVNRYMQFTELGRC